jgi:hypothetical protein
VAGVLSSPGRSSSLLRRVGHANPTRPALPHPPTRAQVTVRTGDVRGAGTDGLVYATLQVRRPGRR